MVRGGPTITNFLVSFSVIRSADPYRGLSEIFTIDSASNDSFLRGQMFSIVGFQYIVELKFETRFQTNSSYM